MSDPTPSAPLVIDLTDAALARRAHPSAPAVHACAKCGAREDLLRLVGTAAPLCAPCFTVVHLSHA